MRSARSVPYRCLLFDDSSGDLEKSSNVPTMITFHLNSTSGSYESRETADIECVCECRRKDSRWMTWYIEKRERERESRKSLLD